MIDAMIYILLRTFGEFRGLAITLGSVMMGYIPEKFLLLNTQFDVDFQRVVWSFAILAALLTSITQIIAIIKYCKKNK